MWKRAYARTDTKMANPDEESLREVFETHDDDGSGTIDEEELRYERRGSSQLDAIRFVGLPSNKCMRSDDFAKIRSSVAVTCSGLRGCSVASCAAS